MNRQQIDVLHVLFLPVSYIIIVCQCLIWRFDMKKHLANEAIRLTSEFMEAFYSGNPDPVYAAAAPDITWIGAQRGQFDIGFKEFHDDIEKVLRDLSPSRLTNQRYLISQNNGCICTVIGTYHVVSVDHTGAAFDGEQRLVAVWRLEKDGLKLVHLSNTSPIGEWKVTKEEHFPLKMSSFVREYINRQIKEKTDPGLLIVTDTEKSRHCLREPEIFLLESENKYTAIYLKDSVIRTKELLKTFEPKLSPVFLRISRFNIINMSKIASFRDQELILTNGQHILIPSRKIPDIHKAVYRFFDSEKV